MTTHSQSWTRSLSSLAPAGALAFLLALSGAAPAQLVFQAPVGSTPCENARVLVLGDVNEDGHLDAITGSFSNGPQPALSLGLGNGHFAAPVTLTMFFGGANVLRLVDFDEDGHLDALANNGDVGSSSFAVHLGDGLGSFGPPIGVNLVGEIPGDADAGDFNGDGRVDLAVVGNATSPGGSRLNALLNHTYPAGSPFTDLGGQSQGLGGYPIQLASGTLVAGQPFSFKLVGVIPSQLAYHVVGFTQLNAPFKGGTMVPNPFLINGPFAANGAGVLNLAGAWPAGGSGVTLYTQFWVPNFLGFGTFSASSGVRAQIP